MLHRRTVWKIHRLTQKIARLNWLNIDWTLIPISKLKPVRLKAIGLNGSSIQIKKKMRRLKLGLIGVGIEKSRSPELHLLAGHLCGIDITYDLLPLESPEQERFDKTFSECMAQGYCAVNVTHPFKERAAEVVNIESEQVQKIGAVNTVRFSSEIEPQGFNTDYTGFKRTFESRFPGQPPGKVAIVGAGGVGRAIAFGLLDLHAEEIRLFDQEAAKSESLAIALRTQTDSPILICRTLEEAVIEVDGIINATPIGMHNHPGTPIPRFLIEAQSWVFDAVYTPVETHFFLDSMDAGLEILSGYELFFYQGVEAFEIFSGVRVDESLLLSELPGPSFNPAIASAEAEAFRRRRLRELIGS
jgi:shikimate dehydrogenase